MNISVVIPSYNRYEQLKRALESVFAQSYEPKEIIVIDDGSTDNTSQIKNDFARIKYYHQENCGVSSARNLGIKESSYDWISFLDSDDEWHRDKLKLQVEFHRDNKDIFISYTNEIWIRDFKEVKIPKKYQKIGGHIFKECLSHCFIAPSSVMIHKKLFEDIGLFDGSLDVCEDYDLWIRISSRYEIGLIDEKLITKHGGAPDQLSIKYWGMDRFRCRSLEKILNKGGINSNLIKETLISKYRLLLKGAKKHNRLSDVKKYEYKIRILEC